MPTTQPVKNLSGGGFTFEDRVGAWLAASMIAGAAPLDPEQGIPVRIDFQVGADGWRLDDVLITFTTARCCGSVKSFAQVTGGTASSDFVLRAWEDIAGISDAGFNADADLVAMISAPLELSARGDLEELIRLARAQDPDEIAARVAVDGYVSGRRRTLFNSLARPAETVGKGAATIGNSAGELLQRLRLLEADFEYSPSRAAEQALAWCRRALADESYAAGLWGALLEIVAEHRTAGGQITSTLLVSLLKDRFDLSDHPVFEQDWSTLRALSGANVQQISDRVGGGLHLDRAGLRSDLDTALADSRFVAVVGPSGCGKSALVKAWASGSSSDEIVVLRAEQLATLAQPNGGLQHVLLDVLGAARRRVWVAVDGLDRVFSGDADSAVATITAAVAQDPLAPLGLLITCQQQEWAPVGNRLAACNAVVDWRIVSATSFSDEELADVLSTYPELRDVAYRGRLTGGLQNAKVLDTILRALASGTLGQDVSLTGEESLFAKWFYEQLAMGNGPHRAARGAFTLRLAEQQGDRQQRETPLTDLDAAGLEYLDELERDGVCAQRDGRVRFAHDLYGDWIRRCLILAHDADRAQYVRAKLTSPLWHRAIRLHALSLLETGGPDAWRQEMTYLGGEQLGLLHDLFLEATLFAADPVPVLANVWPVLVGFDGLLLRRLLVRFLHVATVPNPRLLAAVGDGYEDLTIHVAATQRLPYWPLWVPLLRVLCARSEDAIAHAGDEAARITDLWLRWTPTDFPLRAEVAGLAIALGRHVLDRIRGGERVPDEAAALAWRAVLACAHERPADIAEIGAALAPRAERNPSEHAGELISGGRRGVRVDQAFRTTCLDSDALHPIIVADPELAAELLFLVLEPRPPTGGWGLPGDEIGIDRVTNWFIPLYTRGPFLAFLRTAPTQAVALVARLIDVTTDRWAETRQREVTELALTLEGGTVIRLRGMTRSCTGTGVTRAFRARSRPC